MLTVVRCVKAVNVHQTLSGPVHAMREAKRAPVNVRRQSKGLARWGAEGKKGRKMLCVAVMAGTHHRHHLALCDHEASLGAMQQRGGKTGESETERTFIARECQTLQRESQTFGG